MFVTLFVVFSVVISAQFWQDRGLVLLIAPLCICITPFNRTMQVKEMM